MCLSCSIFCGRCRPAPFVSFNCPSCGTRNEVSREDCIRALGYRDRKVGKVPVGYAVHCTECGENLNGCIKDEVKPMDCKRSGIVCGYPCGKHWKELFPGDLVCEKQVPLGKIGSMPDVTLYTKSVAQIKRSRRMTPIVM